MKKNSIVTFFVMILFLSLISMTFAQDVEKKFGIAGRLVYYGLSDDQVQDTSLQWSRSLLYEGSLTYFFTGFFSLELSGGYTDPNLARTEPGVAQVDFGRLKQIPVLLNGRFVYWAVSEIGIYFGGGVGYYFNDFELTDLAASRNPNLVVNIDDSFGFQANAGVEFFLNDKLSMNWDLRYVWNEADFAERDPGSAERSFEIDLDAFVFGIGIKYYF